MSILRKTFLRVSSCKTFTNVALTAPSCGSKQKQRVKNYLRILLELIQFFPHCILCHWNRINWPKSVIDILRSVSATWVPVQWFLWNQSALYVLLAGKSMSFIKLAQRAGFGAENKSVQQKVFPVNMNTIRVPQSLPAGLRHKRHMVRLAQYCERLNPLHIYVCCFCELILLHVHFGACPEMVVIVLDRKVSSLQWQPNIAGLKSSIAYMWYRCILFTESSFISKVSNGYPELNLQDPNTFAQFLERCTLQKASLVVPSTLETASLELVRCLRTGGIRVLDRQSTLLDNELVASELLPHFEAPPPIFHLPSAWPSISNGK